MFGRFKTPSRKTAARALFVAATVAVTLELTACADLRQVASLDPGGVDPSSAIAREAVAASRSRPRMPRFAEIPKAPGDIVAALSIKSDVGVLVGERRALNRRIARLPPTQSDTDQFAARDISGGTDERFRVRDSRRRSASAGPVDTRSDFPAPFVAEAEERPFASLNVWRQARANSGSRDDKYSDSVACRPRGYRRGRSGSREVSRDRA